MNVQKKELPKSKLELIFELTAEELAPHLTEAAEEISKSRKISGFRQGKAPLKVVMQQAGEMTVYQTAANLAIAKAFYDYVKEQKIETIDQPAVEVQKLAPGNPFIFKATVALMPAVTICEWEKVSVKQSPEIKVEDKELDKILADIQKMRQKEVLEDKAIENGDLAEIDFETFVDKVAIDGGQAKKHRLAVGSGQMIPGFEENILGLKKGEEKEFELAFPKKYHQKSLENKKATFRIKVQAVYKVELPELNDEFAKSLGLKDLAGLKGNISNNIKLEKEAKEKQRLELEIIDRLIDKCTFSELPESLIDDETHKMVHELEENTAKQGMKFEDYLSHIKKSEAELMLEFVPEAIKRVKTAIVMRAIAKREKIEVKPEELEAEKKRTLASYQLNPAYADQMHKVEKSLKTENATHYFMSYLTNRKTMKFLVEKVVRKD